MSEKKKKQYLALLQTDEWKAKRLEIFKRDKFTCVECGGNKTLQVHHKKYITGRLPWDYPNSLLRTLCKGCHQKLHDTTEVRSEKDRRPTKKPSTVKAQKKKARQAKKADKLKVVLLRRDSTDQDISTVKKISRRKRKNPLIEEAERIAKRFRNLNNQ